MSFQTYIENTKAQTGLSPADFKKTAQAKGLLAKGGALKHEVKAGQFVQWLKDDYGLVQGHAMDFATLKGKTE